MSSISLPCGANVVFHFLSTSLVGLNSPRSCSNLTTCDPYDCLSRSKIWQSNFAVDLLCPWRGRNLVSSNGKQLMCERASVVRHRISPTLIGRDRPIRELGRTGFKSKWLLTLLCMSSLPTWSLLVEQNVKYKISNNHCLLSFLSDPKKWCSALCIFTIVIVMSISEA